MKKKIVLAFSGGLDTSVILKWLQQEYGAEVITFTADIGQEDEIQEEKESQIIGRKENLYRKFM